MEKISKAEAYYRVADIPGQNCGNCSMFRPRENFDNGLCTAVTGVIEPEDTCDLWEAKSAPRWILGALGAAALVWLFNKRGAR